jgi:hypothetical protein
MFATFEIWMSSEVGIFVVDEEQNAKACVSQKLCGATAISRGKSCASCVIGR